MIKGLSDFDGDIDAFIEAVKKAKSKGEPLTDFAQRQFVAAIQKRLSLKDKVRVAVKTP